MDLDPADFTPPDPAPPPRRPRLRLRHLLALTASVVLAIAIAAGIGLAYWLKPYAKKAEQVDLSLLDDYDVSTVFYDRDGGELGRIFTENRILLDGPIPPLVRSAIVAAEDHRFYHHHGIDWRGLARAALADLRHQKILQGGSTLTQQLSKHLINDFARNLDRKIYESFVALRIEHRYSKEQILRYYLNRVYFGSGYFGIEAASEGYFGKKADDLSIGEAALLCGVVRSPNRNSPRIDPGRALHHRDIVLAAMVQLNMITPAQAAVAKDEPLHLAPEKNPGQPDDYYIAAARQELEGLLAGAENEETPQGLKIVTTIDPAVQKQADDTFQTFLPQIESRIAAASPASTPAPAPLEGAAVLLDASTGGIRAMIGGRDFKKSQYDRASMAHREVGALLQPFLYAAAFKSDGLNLTPATLLNVSSFDLDGAASPDYPKPDSLETPVTAPEARFATLQDALAVGSPYAAARVELLMGSQSFADWLATALNRSVPNGATPSWKREAPTLLEIASLYQALGNGGQRFPPHLIDKIVNRRGEVLFDRSNREPVAVVDPVTAAQIDLTLQPAVREGVARALTNEYHFPAPVTGMAGYSVGYRDASFAGFSNGLVGAVWVGYDDGRPLGSLATETALPLWDQLMRTALPHGLPPSAPLPVAVPDELRKYEIDRRTGALVGPGHLTPAPGDAFVYLTSDQSDLLTQSAAAPAPADAAAPSGPGLSAPPVPARNPADWSDYLGTLLAADPANANANASPSGVAATPRDADIPRVADYRLPALRGAILSAEGSPLAETVQSQSLVLPWPPISVASDADAAIAWAHTQMADAEKWLGAPIALGDDRLRSLYRYQRFQPITVAENLQPEQVAAFPASGLALRFTLQGVPIRSYANGYLAAHALGYLHRLQARNYGRYQAGEVMYGDYTGASGLEQAFDSTLRGTEGKLSIRTTPDGFSESASVLAPATMGANLRSTIRLPVQQIVERALSNVSSGAMVILDVRTGDVVAMASRPTFDPNEFLPVLDADAWKRLSDPTIHPLQNRVTTEEHPPGSVFKTVTTLAALRAGLLHPDAVFQTDGIFDVGNVEYKIPDEKGSYNFREAMANSINMYFFDLGLKVGRDTLIATAKELGIGQPTGIVIGEKNGRMPDDAFVRAAHQRSFGPGDITNTAIGQGDVLVTPLQLARLMEVIANEGTGYEPRLVSDVETAPDQVTQTFPPKPNLDFTLAPSDWKILKDALQAVTDEGTGKLAQPDNVRISGKTGTAQVGSKAEPRQITWFAGYAPSENPQYAFAVMMDGPPGADLYAATTTAPIVAHVFKELYEALPPKAEPVTPSP